MHYQVTDKIERNDYSEETLKEGVFENNNGTFTAMTFTQSKTFKTLKGAQRWLKRKQELAA